jgi:glycosyltransferase involved in cell wall biosynthesis
MIIGMDMRAQGLYGGGIGRYHENLYKALKDNDDKNDYIPLNIKRECITGENILSKVKRYTRRKLSNKILACSLGIDIFHTSYFDLPCSARMSSVLTIHDLAYIRYPDILPKYLVAYLKTMGKKAVRQANSIIAVSESTKVDICEFLYIDEEKVDVIYEGADHLIGDKKQGNVCIERIPCSQEYILFVGTVEPRKNLLNLVKAFQIIAKEKNITEKLVIVGRLGYKGKEIVDGIRKVGLPEEKLLFTGYLKDEEMIGLYRHAKLFVMPSIYEGFGIPVIEAMACGCPVACSGVSSLPEIVGKAGVFFDPFKINEIAEVIHGTLTDQDILRQLAKLGRERAKCFSWQKAAEGTMAIYNRFS